MHWVFISYYLYLIDTSVFFSFLFAAPSKWYVLVYGHQRSVIPSWYTQAGIITFKTSIIKGGIEKFALKQPIFLVISSFHHLFRFPLTFSASRPQSIPCILQRHDFFFLYFARAASYLMISTSACLRRHKRGLSCAIDVFFLSFLINYPFAPHL